jgi:hypothetical protein
MNKKGKVAVELLIMLVTIVITSAIIFMLVQADVIKVKPGNADVNVLNTEFIPMGREGFLAIRDFTFCDFISEDYQCTAPGENFAFALGNAVHFRFVVESSTYNGDIKLIQNYRIKDPNGNLLLDVDEKNNFHFDIKSDERKELITFKDFFYIGEELPEGIYTLELIISNPLLDKKTTQIKTFEVIFIGDDFYQSLDIGDE